MNPSHLQSSPKITPWMIIHQFFPIQPLSPVDQALSINEWCVITPIANIKYQPYTNPSNFITELQSSQNGVTSNNGARLDPNHHPSPSPHCADPSGKVLGLHRRNDGLRQGLCVLHLNQGLGVAVELLGVGVIPGPPPRASDLDFSWENMWKLWKIMENRVKNRIWDRHDMGEMKIQAAKQLSKLGSLGNLKREICSSLGLNEEHLGMGG